MLYNEKNEEINNSNTFLLHVCVCLECLVLQRGNHHEQKAKLQGLKDFCVHKIRVGLKM